MYHCALRFISGAPVVETPAAAKSQDAYRNFDAPARDTVREFYRQNHAQQTYDFVVARKADYLRFNRREMTWWDALDYLNTLVDDSDPDIALPQIDHLLQTAEAMRADGQPDWMVLTGFIHDLGKVLCLFGEPQWAVVGDTFPTGCPYSPKIVYSEFFAENPDLQRTDFQTGTGIYKKGCGLSNVQMSWGHDEYLYHLTRNYLPQPAQYMIRFHSFYAWHREGAYGYLLDDTDRAMLPWVQKFNPYDLYSKNPERPQLADLKPYYDSLMAKYLPATIRF
jgi:inositol oxygenase